MLCGFFEDLITTTLLELHQSMLVSSQGDASGLAAELGSIREEHSQSLVAGGSTAGLCKHFSAWANIDSTMLLFTRLKTDSRHSLLISTPVHYRNINLMQTAQQKLMSTFMETQIKPSFIS